MGICRDGWHTRKGGKCPLNQSPSDLLLTSPLRGGYRLSSEQLGEECATGLGEGGQRGRQREIALDSWSKCLIVERQRVNVVAVTLTHGKTVKRLLSDDGNTSGPLVREDRGDARGGSTAGR